MSLIWLLSTIDYLTGKQSLTSIFDNIIKIYQDELDLPDLTSFLTSVLPFDQPNLNQRNKSR